MVVSRAQLISSSISVWSVKEGTCALLYLGHISIHLDHSKAKVLNFIRDFPELHTIITTNTSTHIHRMFVHHWTSCKVKYQLFLPSAKFLFRVYASSLNIASNIPDHFIPTRAVKEYYVCRSISDSPEIVSWTVTVFITRCPGNHVFH